MLVLHQSTGWIRLLFHSATKRATDFWQITLHTNFFAVDLPREMAKRSMNTSSNGPDPDLRQAGIGRGINSSGHLESFSKGFDSLGILALLRVFGREGLCE